MEFRQTKHQVARSARPDAEAFGKLLLIKGASELHATYQIRLLTYRAVQERVKLIVEVSKECKIHADLRELAKLYSKAITIVRS
jgi:hypothetical protein